MVKYNIYLYAFVVFGTSDITLKCLLKGEPDEKKTTNPTSPLITKQLRVREYQKFEDNWIYRSFQAIFLLADQTRSIMIWKECLICILSRIMHESPLHPLRMSVGTELRKYLALSVKRIIVYAIFSSKSATTFILLLFISMACPSGERRVSCETCQHACCGLLFSTSSGMNPAEAGFSLSLFLARYVFLNSISQL